MRVLNRLWTLAPLLAGLLPQAPQAQNAPSPLTPPGQFSFNACNNSGLTLSFAFVYLNSATDLRFRTKGWYLLNPGECPRSLGNFTVGKFYYFAAGIAATKNVYLVQGTALQQCVHVPEAFDRFNLGGGGCQPFPRGAPIPAGEYLAGFAEVSVPPTVDSVTVSIKPLP